jgi:transcriptional regulator with GAF, ATPase, and Fis domain
MKADRSDLGGAAVAEAFVALADTLVDDYDVVDLMDRLASTCVDLLDVTAAGILLKDLRGSLHLVASSSEETRLLELFQLQDEEGPCLDCISSGAPVSSDDLRTNGRWPRFSSAAAHAGFTAVYAVPMRLRSEVIGGINLFRFEAGPFGPTNQRIAQALADVATIGVLQQRSLHRAGLLAEQLQTALDSRITIEQAKGVLAQRGGLPMEAAYGRLRQHARDGNHRLSQLAHEVIKDNDIADAVLRGRLPLP